jgi:hypothetical protein
MNNNTISNLLYKSGKYHNKILLNKNNEIYKKKLSYYSQKLLDYNININQLGGDMIENINQYKNSIFKNLDDIQNNKISCNVKLSDKARKELYDLIDAIYSENDISEKAKLHYKNVIDNLSDGILAGNRALQKISNRFPIKFSEVNGDAEFVHDDQKKISDATILLKNKKHYFYDPIITTIAIAILRELLNGLTVDKLIDIRNDYSNIVNIDDKKKIIDIIGDINKISNGLLKKYVEFFNMPNDLVKIKNEATNLLVTSSLIKNKSQIEKAIEEYLLNKKSINQQPSSVQPSSVQPSSVQPSSVQPSSVQPSSVQPSSVQPPSVQPPSVQPPSVQPSSVQPSSVQPSSVQPHIKPLPIEHVQPLINLNEISTENSETAIKDNENTRSSFSPVQTRQKSRKSKQSSPVQPSPVQSSPVQPSPVQPSPVQPSPVQPSPVPKQISSNLRNKIKKIAKEINNSPLPIQSSDKKYALVLCKLDQNEKDSMTKRIKDDLGENSIMIEYTNHVLKDNLIINDSSGIKIEKFSKIYLLRCNFDKNLTDDKLNIYIKLLNENGTLQILTNSDNNSIDKFTVQQIKISNINKYFEQLPQNKSNSGWIYKPINTNSHVMSPPISYPISKGIGTI